MLKFRIYISLRNWYRIKNKQVFEGKFQGTTEKCLLSK